MDLADTGGPEHLLPEVAAPVLHQEFGALAKVMDRMPGEPKFVDDALIIGRVSATGIVMTESESSG